MRQREAILAELPSLAKAALAYLVVAQPRPLVLLSYRNLSARPTRLLAVSLGRFSVPPTEIDIWIGRLPLPEIEICPTMATHRFARSLRISMLTFRTMARNSSPPHRPTASVGRSAPTKVFAARCNTRSPLA